VIYGAGLPPVRDVPIPERRLTFVAVGGGRRFKFEIRIRRESEARRGP